MAKKKTTRKKTSRAKAPKAIKTIKHKDASRANLPTAEYQSVIPEDVRQPVEVSYPRGQGGLEAEKAARNPDLDPQLVWRGKDTQDQTDLVVQAPPLYIQEKVHPKALIDDLRRQTNDRGEKQELLAEPALFADLYADFNGVPEGDAKTEFYEHEANWTNRMILGDSLQVMTSLAEREGLRGKVQCIYLDPPYGIKFNSNFQWSTTTRDVKDGKADHITREPEMVKAFRDTWRDGIHSYLSYLRDRLTIARDLLHESGSIFVQIGDENVHRVRALLDEIFGTENAVSSIIVWKTSSQTSDTLPSTCDYVLWYARSIDSLKFRAQHVLKDINDPSTSSGEYKLFWRGFGSYLTEKQWNNDGAPDLRRFRPSPSTSQSGGDTTRFPYNFKGGSFKPKTGGWKSNITGFERLEKADRIMARTASLSYVRFLDDFPVVPVSDLWTDTRWGFDASEKRYVVETNPRVVQRCLLMATDPGDLVLDPTCGSGTTATVAEQWGRRWITIDTSRVALALARARVMGARYPYYHLADSKEGVLKEAEIERRDIPAVAETKHYAENIRHGFVYQRVPHITLKSIANNTEIDVIWEQMQPAVESALADLNNALAGHKIAFPVDTGGRKGAEIDFTAKGKTAEMPSGESAPADGFMEWEAPREAPDHWPAKAKTALGAFWEARIARQKAIDASIADKAEYEYLYDKPYEDKKKVRVAGPFTVESASPHRSLIVDPDDELIDPAKDPKRSPEEADFAQMILCNLRAAGVQQAHKEDKINFTTLTPWPGEYIAAEGRFVEENTGAGSKEKRAGIFIGPEFGTVGRQDLVRAAREAGDAGFDVVIACAFNYEAHASELSKLGGVPVLKARMNADLHMAEDLKNTGKGNLFVIFGEPDVEIETIQEGEDKGKYRVHIRGVDVFHPQSGEIRSDGAEGIACWFIDTDYNEESFFVRHAYFLGASDPYKSLKTTLKAEIDAEAWSTLNSDVSRPFDKPESGRIAVKVINHLGDEVMKVYRVE